MLATLRVSSNSSSSGLRQVASRRCLSTSIRSSCSSSPRSVTLPSTSSPTSPSSSTRKVLPCLPRSIPSLITPSASRSFHLSAISREVVKVPQMAESISEGTLKQWVKKKGDFVKADEEVATIETDKIDVSVNAPQSGTIVELYAEEEDTVEVGKDLFKLEPGEEPSGDGGESKEASGSSSEESSSTPSESKEGQDGGNKQESQLKKDQAENKEGKEQGGGDTKPKPKPASSGSESSSSSSSSGSSTSKSPETKPPSSASSSPSSSSGSSSSKKSNEKLDTKTAATPGSRDETRVKMSRMRLRIAERLKQSQNTAASLTTFNEIDMSNLMAFRAKHKDNIMKHHGVKLGFMSAFAKASATALKEIPAANASIEGDGLGDTIVYRDYVDLSVAVSTEKGLVTPVVRNVEGMGLIQIEREIAELGKKARDNKLTLEDMSGGTFTISNGGVFGSLFGTPILNLPGSAILGMHAIVDKPWVVNGKVEIRPIMVVALTYDHRLLDGREAVTFLVRLKQYIEDMGSMLL